MEPFDLLALLEAIEKEAILKAIDAANGNKTKAAKLIGMKRSTIVMKLSRWGMKLNPKPEPKQVLKIRFQLPTP